MCVCVFDEPALRRKTALVGSLRRKRRRTCALCFWFCLVILSGDPERGLHIPNSQKLLSVSLSDNELVFEFSKVQLRCANKQTNKQTNGSLPHLHHLTTLSSCYCLFLALTTTKRPPSDTTPFAISIANCYSAAPSPPPPPLHSGAEEGEEEEEGLKEKEGSFSNGGICSATENSHLLCCNAAASSPFCC